MGAFDDLIPQQQQPAPSGAFDDLIPAQQPGLVSNASRNAGERVLDLAGNLVQFIGNTAEKGEAAIAEKLGGFNPGVMFGSPEELQAAGYEPDISLGGFGLDFTSRADPQHTDTGLTTAGQAVEDVSLGYQPDYTIDRALDNPSLETIAGAVAEQGPAALADMAGLFLGTAPYLGSRVQEVAEARVENDGREGQPELMDLAKAAPGTAASVMLDKLALGKLMPGSGKAITSVKQIPGEVAKATGREALTEAIQEGGLEYASETVGTEKGYDPSQAVRRALGGALIGGPTGGVVRTGTSVMEMRTQVREELANDGQDPNAFTDEQIDALVQQVEATSQANVQASEEVAPNIDEAAGVNTPGPLGEGMAPVEARQARRQAEKELSSLFQDTDILRRDDVEVSEDGISLREGAEPVRDVLGEQANPESYGPRTVAARTAERLGLTLGDTELQAVAKELAADPGAPPAEVVRAYARESQESAFSVAEARRNRREQNLRRDDLSEDWTPERDFRAGVGAEADLTPRMQQELEANARPVQPGINEGQPGQPQNSVDRITSNTAAGLRGELLPGEGAPTRGPLNGQQGAEVEGDVIREAAPLDGRTAEAEVTAIAQGGLPALEADPAVNPDRRQDTERRRRVAEMTPEEMRSALLEDDLTGLGNRRAYDESPRKPVQVSVDADSLKWVNDNMGHGAGDEMLRAIGRAFKAAGADAYHPSGDEYWVQANTEAEAEDVMRRVTADLAGATIEFETPAGERITKKGVGLSYGTANTLEQAEEQLQRHKSDREKSGDRAGRGETPPGVTRINPGVSSNPAEGNADNSGEAPQRSDGSGEQLGFKLYSGIPVDAIWKGLKKVAGAEGEQFKSMAHNVGQLMEDAREASGGLSAKNRASKRSVLTDWWRVTLGSLDGDLRTLVGKFKSDTLKSLPDMFHATAGADAGVEQTFDEAVQSRNKRLNAIDDLVEKMTKSKLLGKDAQQQIIRMVENPKTPRRGVMGDIANEIDTFLKEEMAYLREAGVELGEVRDGYFPREVDSGKAATNPDKFLAQATKAYQATGLKGDDATAAAKAYWESVVYGAAAKPGVHMGGSSTPSFVQSRVFSKAAAEHLKDFRVADIDAVLGQYVMRATKRAEIARRFGDNWSNWAEIEQQILAEDAEAQAVLPLVRDRVALSAGVQLHNMAHSAQAGLSMLRTWTTLATLPKAAMASLGELVIAPIRGTTGSIPGDIAQNALGLLSHTGHFVNTLSGMGRTEKLQAAFEMAEDIGIIAGTGHNSLMAARFAGGDPVGRIQSKVLASFFRRNLLEGLTNYTRVTSMQQGQVFLRRLAAQMDGHGKRAGYFLRELGVPRGKEAAFADWLNGYENGLPMAGEVKGEFAAVYRNALQRFVDQTVMRPSASTRPKWASHPLGAVLFQLQAFGYAFQKNFINRIGRATKGLDGMEKLAFTAAATPGILLLVGAQGLFRYLRDEVYNPEINDRKTDAAFVEGAISQAGLFGVADPYLQSLTGIKYQRSIFSAFLGPALGGLTEAGDDFASAMANNSPNTNTAERNLAKSTYDWLIEPIMQTALTVAPAGPITGKLASAATIYGVPSGRDPFADLVAGKAEKKASKKEIQSTVEWLLDGSPGEVSRSGGRSTSRSSGREGGR